MIFGHSEGHFRILLGASGELATVPSMVLVKGVIMAANICWVLIRCKALFQVTYWYPI